MPLPAHLSLFPFLVGVSAALPGQRALLDELPAAGEAVRFAGSCFGAEFSPVRLPGSGAPRGLARIGKVLWFARGEQLFRLSWPRAQPGPEPEPEVELAVDAPPGLAALCADERFVYGLVDGRIVVPDPIAGRVTRTIEASTEETRAVALAKGGDRFVLGSAAGVFAAAAAPGGRPVRLGDWAPSDCSLLAEGDRLLVLGVEGIRTIPLPDATAPPRQWPWPWRAAACATAWVDGRLLFVAERGNADPRDACIGGLLDLEHPGWHAERLTIHCYPIQLMETARFVVGAKSLADVGAVQRELERIAVDPSMRSKRPDGKTGPLPVVIEARPGVCIAAVTSAWDAATAAGFDRVSAPAQESWVRERQRSRTPK